MSYPRFLLAGTAVWVVSVALGYLINDVWLVRLYQANAWAFRRATDVNALVPIGLAAQFLGSIAFAFAYAKGYDGEGSAIGEGIRFGLVIAVLIDGFAVVWNYVTQPIAPRLGVLEMITQIGQFGVLGAVVGLIYQPRRLTIPKDLMNQKYDLRG
jgi:hypothetical protein